MSNAIVVDNALFSTVCSTLLLTAPAKNEHRVTLENMLLEVKDATFRAVTTDGHRMSVWSSTMPADDARVLVPIETIRAVAKALKALKSSTAFQVTIHDDAIYLEAPAGMQTFKFADPGVQFPAWEQVMPAKGREPKGRVGVNAQYFADACEAFSIAHKHFGRSRSPGMAIELGGELDPALMYHDDLPLSVVVMPMRM